jgi:hypothetical protein
MTKLMPPPDPFLARFGYPAQLHNEAALCWWHVVDKLRRWTFTRTVVMDQAGAVVLAPRP